MHQRHESIQAKRHRSSNSKHTRNSTRRNEPIRRTWSHGLPSINTDAVHMLVMNTSQVNVTTTNISDDKVSTSINNDKNENKNNKDDNDADADNNNNNDDDDDDDDNEHMSNIGQDVQAHIPDIVLNNLNDLINCHGSISIPNEHRYHHTTLLFLDVSGFTSLTEQYSNDAHLGIGQLTRTLNCYFDKLVYEILIQDGDIYKFAGDAILALWTNERTGPSQAFRCALNLQQKCGAYETDVGVVLRLKIALAYGPVRALFVGTDEFKHYLLTGDCVKDVNICEQLCEPGDIIITRMIHERLSAKLFTCEFLAINGSQDGQHEHFLVQYMSTLSRASIDINEQVDSSSTFDDSTMVCRSLVVACLSIESHFSYVLLLLSSLPLMMMIDICIVDLRIDRINVL
jgi:class 3 adenylate cyclase